MMDPNIAMALSIGVPTLTVLIGILVSNSRQSDLGAGMRDLRAHMDQGFGQGRADMNQRFDRVDQRFDDMKDLWRDARMKRLERH
jgi:hypothetical protein